MKKDLRSLFAQFSDAQLVAVLVFIVPVGKEYESECQIASSG